MDYYHEIKLGFLNYQNADLGEFLPQSVAQDVKTSLVCIKQNCELTNVCKDALEGRFGLNEAQRIVRAFEDTLSEDDVEDLLNAIESWARGEKPWQAL